MALGLSGGLVATTDGISSRAVAATQDVVSILRGRSPGARGPTLASKKGKGYRVAAPLIREKTGRVAPDLVTLVPPVGPVADIPELAFVYGPPLFAQAPLLGGGAPVGFTGGRFAGLPVLVAVGGGGVGGGGGGGGGGTTPPPIGGGGGGTPPPPGGGGETPPVVSPVPEPDSWAMMLFGFGAVGWTLRARRRPGLSRSTSLAGG